MMPDSSFEAIWPLPVGQGGAGEGGGMGRQADSWLVAREVQAGVFNGAGAQELRLADRLAYP